MISERLKRYVPSFVLAFYRTAWQRVHKHRLLSTIPTSGRELYRRSALTTYDNVVLPPEDESVRQAVIQAAKAEYGDSWNFYSDALRPEIALGFVRTIDRLIADRNVVAYLEIGSCQGLSLSLIGLLLRRRGITAHLVSIDPYFSRGYDEGSSGPYQTEKHIDVDKKTRISAFRLYEALGLTIELLETVSDEGMKQLLRKGALFDLIYIDGYHEKLIPVVDFGLSCAILSPGGIIILDDHMWPDVLPIKRLCDTHAEQIQETWKTASYRF